MHNKKSRIEKIASFDKGGVYFFSVTNFPIPATELQEIYQVINSILKYFSSVNSKLSLELLLRQQCFYTGLLDIFVKNASKWQPVQALGISPHKPAPRMSSPDKLKSVDIKAMHKKGIENIIDLPDFVFHIMSKEGKEQCLSEMKGHGALSLILTKLQKEDLHKNWNENFGSRITDPHFSGMPLFAPMLGIKTFEQHVLDEWIQALKFFDLYIAECKEDQGVLLVSIENLDEVIEQHQSTLQQLPDKSETQFLRW